MINSRADSPGTSPKFLPCNFVMPRSLRPRRTRQSYTDLFHSEDEGGNEPGPSLRRLPSTQQEDDSGSDFAPGEAEPDDGVGDDVGAGIDSPSSNGSDINAPLTTRSKKKGGKPATSQGKDKRKRDPTATTKAKAKGKQKAQVTPTPVPTAAALTVTATAPPTAPPATRQNHALPNPNIHHRHRPIPLFPGPTAPAVSASGSGSGSVRVERLQRAPRLFAPNETVPTNAYASTAVPLLRRRIGRAWGVSVGAGPVWELVEDLGWFREGGEEAQTRVGGEGAEAQALGQGQVVVCDESARRPRVHADVVLPQGWTVFRRAECVFPLLLFSPADQFSRASALSFSFIDGVISEMGSRICRRVEAPAPMALWPLHRQSLVTSVRSRTRPGSTLTRLGHKNCVSSGNIPTHPFCLFFFLPS
jgi:transcription factor C subunit 6